MEQDYEKKAEEVDVRSAAYIKSAAERMPDIGRKARARPCPETLCLPSCSGARHPRQCA